MRGNTMSESTHLFNKLSTMTLFNLVIVHAWLNSIRDSHLFCQLENS